MRALFPTWEAGFRAGLVPWIPRVRVSSHSDNATSPLQGCASDTKLQVMLSDNKINVFIFHIWTKQTQNQTVFS